MSKILKASEDYYNTPEGDACELINGEIKNYIKQNQ